MSLRGQTVKEYSQPILSFGANGQITLQKDEKEELYKQYLAKEKYNSVKELQQKTFQTSKEDAAEMEDFIIADLNEENRPSTWEYVMPKRKRLFKMDQDDIALEAAARVRKILKTSSQVVPEVRASYQRVQEKAAMRADYESNRKKAAKVQGLRFLDLEAKEYDGQSEEEAEFSDEDETEIEEKERFEAAKARELHKICLEEVESEALNPIDGMDETDSNLATKSSSDDEVEREAAAVAERVMDLQRGINFRPIPVRQYSKPRGLIAFDF
jgi:hypothetical protein